MDITKCILESKAGATIEVWSKGKSLAEQMFYLVHLGDWLSYHLSQDRKVDPVEIEVIDYLKNALSKV